MTELEKLVDRLCNNPERKLINFNVFWGEKAHLMTAEERAKALNDALDKIDRGEGVRRIPNIDKRQVNIRDFVENLEKSSKN